MRRTSVLFLCSALATSAALAEGCFDNSTSGNDAGANFGDDGGTFNPGDGGSASVDSSSGSREDATAPDASDASDADLGPPSLSVSDLMVDFGPVDCGKGTTKTYSIKNTGKVPVTWSASSSSPVFVIQGASSGTIKPGDTMTATLAVSSVPVTSDPGVPVTGTLTVTTNVPGYTSVAVPLTVTPQGGSLTLTPNLVGFGQVQLTTTSDPLSATITNVGNAPVDVTLGAATDPEFNVTYTGAPAAFTIPPGGKLTGISATFTPTGSGLKTATSAIQTTSPLCASAATALSLSGKGTAASVTVGPDPLDFQSVGCGQPGAPQAVTLKNSYSFAVHYTAALGKGSSSPFVLDAPTGTVPANGKAVINVTPNPIPAAGADLTANAYGDQLTVTTDAPQVPPATVTLEESASGAILGLSMPTTSFGTVAYPAVGSLPFTVTNKGNAPADVSVTTTGGPQFAAALTQSSTVSAGGSIPGDASFQALMNGSFAGTLTLNSKSVLCAPLPAAINLSASGGIPVATFSNATLPVSATCGGGTTNATLNVQNVGLSSLTINNASSQSGTFEVTAFTTTPIIPGSSGTIVIAAKPAGMGSMPGTTNDTLAFTTNEPGGGSYAVPVTVNVVGAWLRFVDGNGSPLPTDPSNGDALLDFTACQTMSYGVQNVGNGTVQVSAGSPYPGQDYAFFTQSVFSTPQPLSNGSTVSESVDIGFYYSEPTDSVCTPQPSDVFTYSVVAGNACNALPALEVSYELPDYSSEGFYCSCYTQNVGVPGPKPPPGLFRRAR